MTVEEVAAQAADLMEERGLAKHTQEDVYGGVCLAGAVSIALCGEPYKYSFYKSGIGDDILRRIAFAQTGSNESSSAVIWNNAPERTVQEVVGALRKVAGVPVGDPHEHRLAG